MKNHFSDVYGAMNRSGRVQEGTSRQRSGKGAIRKKIPTPKTEAGKNQTINQYLYHENIS